MTAQTLVTPKKTIEKDGIKFNVSEFYHVKKFRKKFRVGIHGNLDEVIYFSEYELNKYFSTISDVLFGVMVENGINYVTIKGKKTTFMKQTDFKNLISVENRFEKSYTSIKLNERYQLTAIDETPSKSVDALYKHSNEIMQIGMTCTDNTLRGIITRMKIN